MCLIQNREEMVMATYRGYRTRKGAMVTKDGVPFTPARSLRVMAHSPSGFEWGYGGSGPSQLALALLLDVLNDEDAALAAHQAFKWEVIARLPEEGWTMTTEDIEAWLVLERLSNI